MKNPYQSSGARIAFEGLSRALDAIDGIEIEDTQIAVGQALFWAITLDDRLVKKYPAYRKTRDDDAEGRLADGARFARNAITHGAVIVQSMQSGISIPMTIPYSIGGLRWRPCDSILSDWTDRIEPPRKQLESYSAHFPGFQPNVP